MMTTGKVECGVIGAGWWGTYAHVPALLAHPGAEILAVQTYDPAGAAIVERDFRVPVLSSWEELLGLRELQAVVISSPPHLHYRQARAALLRGLHVLVEKPMTLTATEALDLVQIAATERRHLLVSGPWHYTEHGQEARRLVRAGELGEVRMISVLMTNPVDHLIRGEAVHPTHGEPVLLPQPGTYSDPAIAGGGQIYTQVSHAAAYLAFVTGARPAEVFARFHDDGGRLDIYDCLSISMDSGCIASIASTGATPTSRRDYEVRVFGTRAILYLDLWNGKMELLRLSGGAPVVYPQLAAEAIYPARAPAANLIDCVLGRDENRSPGTLGLAAVEMIEAACRSARTGVNQILRWVTR